MQFEFEENDGRGRFFLQRDGQDLAEIAYHMHGSSVVVIDHTEVDASLEGQGVGKALVRRVVDWAREEGFTIHPVCPFAKKVLEHDPSFHDLLSQHP